MGYLLHLFLALAFQASIEVYGSPIDTPAAWGVVALAAVPYFLAYWSRRMYLAGRFRRADVGFQLLHFSPPFLHLAALLFAGWRTWVQSKTGWSASLLDWPDPGTLLVLLPYLVYGWLALDARARWIEPNVASVRAFHTRMFFGGIAPLVLYGLASWLVGRRETWRVMIEEVSLWSALFAALLIAVLALLLPWLLRNTWNTRPLPEGPELRLFEAIAERAAFRCREIRLWVTGRQMANAAIVGLLPSQRMVLVSDALLSQLPPRELAAVYGHEIGHARRGHVWILGSWTLGLLLVADWASGRLAPDSEGLQLAIFGAGVAAWYVSFGWLARRFELDADCYSWRLLGTTAPLKTALEYVGGGAHAREKKSWRHFSTARRVAFLDQLDETPAPAERVERTIRIARWMGAALFAVALVLQVSELASTYGEDRLVADLRLGHFEQARERVEKLSEVHPQVAAWVERTREFAGETGPDGERLAAAALSAAELGDGQRAFELLGLAALRGNGELEGVRSALRRGLEEGRFQLEEADSSDPAWERAFERLSAADQ